MMERRSLPHVMVGGHHPSQDTDSCWSSCEGHWVSAGVLGKGRGGENERGGKGFTANTVWHLCECVCVCMSNCLLGIQGKALSQN